MLARKLVIEFSEDLSAEDLNDEDVLERSKEAAVLELLRKKKISQGKAAELLGISRQELFDLMAKFEIPVIDMTQKELHEELTTEM